MRLIQCVIQALEGIQFRVDVSGRDDRSEDGEERQLLETVWAIELQEDPRDNQGQRAGTNVVAEYPAEASRPNLGEMLALAYGHRGADEHRIEGEVDRRRSKERQHFLDHDHRCQGNARHQVSRWNRASQAVVYENRSGEG